MATLRHICVYAGSMTGAHQAYLAAAQALGRELAGRGIGIVYGGSSAGLMGALADAALATGGEVIGVLPGALFRREVAHTGLTRLHDVGSMHERKALMERLADGFIALPGGFGTFDELFEMLSWAQLGLHQKPIGVLDSAGYFEPLLALVRHIVDEGFAPQSHATLLLREREPAALLDAFARYTPPTLAAKWNEPPPQP